MKEKTIKNQITPQKGEFEAIILSALAARDCYGAEIVKIVSEKCPELTPLTTGSLYTIMYRLEDKGLVSRVKVQAGARKQLFFYHLTESGEERLQEDLCRMKTLLRASRKLMVPAQDVATTLDAS